MENNKYLEGSRCELKSDILACICAAIIFSSFRNNADGIHIVNPFLRGHRKIVVSCFASNRIKFDTVKIRVVQMMHFLPQNSE